MNKRLFKKIITAVLTAALLFTSNGVASLNASAAEKIKVEGVYANFLKATMSTGTNRQINAYVQPEDATLQKISYKSSAPEIANVSSTGLITALSPGKATITVTALDGSGEYETIAIMVLEDLYITDEHVDSDNDVIVIDKTYGNLTIDASVGDANIYLAGVKVRNKLAMDSGDYSVMAYDSTINNVVIDDGQGEIVSFATDTDNKEDEKVPSLIVGENTDINEIDARISASIRQEDGSKIEGLKITQDKEGRITIYLENYSGGLLLDASLGDMEIVSAACNLESVTVSGGEDVGNVTLTNGKDSTIKNLLLTGAAKLNVALPTTEVTIDSKAKGASFTASEEIGTLKNEGSESVITVSDKGLVNNLEAKGEDAKIEVASGGFVGLIYLNGAGTSLSGAGDVAEAFINANNVSVDTVNTLITVGPVEGAKVQGKDVAGDSTVITERPSSGGGGDGPAEPKPEEPVKAGDIIIDNDFEDGKNDLQVTMGYDTVRATIVDGGNESDKALMVSNRTQNYFGVGRNFSDYLDRRVTVRIKFDIKSSEDAVNRGPDLEEDKKDMLKATMKTNIGSGYEKVVAKTDYDKDVWYTLEGTFELGANVTEAMLYIEAPANVTYYLDNVLITVDRIGDPVAAISVTLSEEEIELNINESKKLTATVMPENAEDKTVTWTSSDPAVASVDANGVVKGLKAGKATITATSNCTYAKTKPSASCEVAVKDLVVIDLDRNYIFLTYVGQQKTLSAGATATWVSDNPAVATVDSSGVVSAVGNGTATITATTSGGMGTCVVNVSIQPEGAVVIDFDDEDVDTTKSMISGGSATIVNDPTALESSNKVLKVELSAGFSQVPYMEIILPEGKKLGDYTSLKAKMYLKEGDVTWKTLRAWAGSTSSDITVGYNASDSQLGESEQKTKNTGFEEVTVVFDEMSTSQRNMTEKITLAFGIMSYATDNDGNGTIPTTYYLDELVLVPYAGDPVAIEDVTLNKIALELVEGKTEQLIATIIPEGYTTNGEITWTSSNETVATVDANGKVTAKAVGTAIITAKTAIDGVSEDSYEATCAVTVDPRQIEIVPGYEDFELMEVGDTLTWLGGGEAKVIVDPNNSANKLLEVKPTGYSQAPIIEIVLPDGKTLADYKQIKFKALWKSGDIDWKDVTVEAATSLEGQFYNDASSENRRIAEGFQTGSSPTIALEEITLNLSGKQSQLSGVIQIAIGIHCGGEKESLGGSTVYYLDDIMLVPKGDVSEKIILTDSSSPTYGLNIEASAISGSALTIDGVENVVAISGGDLVASGQQWAVASIDLSEHVGKTVTIVAKIRRSTEGNYAWQVNSNYDSIDPKWGASADTWYDVSGSLEIKEACQLYLSPGPTVEDTMYYISEVVIKVE